MAYRPTLTVTPALLSTLEAIAALREKILSATIQVVWIPALQKDARVRNTHSSTAIEGNPLTLEQVVFILQRALADTERGLGALNLDAVVHVAPFRPAADGTFA